MNDFVSHDMEVKGQAGDQFGAVNSLFTGLAFGFVILTLFLQRKELELQRRELIKTREEHAGMRDQLARQRFESTFFQLIQLNHGIVDAMKYDRDHTGRISFDQLYSQMRTARRPDVSAQDAFHHVYNSFERMFGHWLRNIYEILLLIRSSAGMMAASSQRPSRRTWQPFL